MRIVPVDDGHRPFGPIEAPDKMIRHDRAAGSGAENKKFFRHFPFSYQESFAI
jgi:hypothetical protein